MKSIVLSLLAVLATSSAFAHEGGDFGQIVCIQNKGYTPSTDGTEITAVLTQVEKTRYYQMIIFQQSANGPRKAVFSDQLLLTTEDVMASFKGKQSRLVIYTDELNESYIRVGRKTTHLICKPNLAVR